MNSQPVLSDLSRVYVIGDIHGRADLLDRIIVLISRDLEANPVSDCLTVTLGIGTSGRRSRSSLAQTSRPALNM
jgi:hypothetical protein